MHILNSAHVGAAIILGLIVVMVGFGVAAILEVIHERRQHRAHIEPCEYQSSDYQEKP